LGGAHRNPENMADILKTTIQKHLKELLTLSKSDLLRTRYKKFRNIGKFLND